MKNKLYIIEGKTYLDHINDEVHLYGLLHQLAFLASRIKDEEDMRLRLETKLIHSIVTSFKVLPV